MGRQEVHERDHRGGGDFGAADRGRADDLCKDQMNRTKKQERVWNSLLFFVVRKPLARRVVPKKTIVDNEGRKTPFAIIDARSGNCTKEAKGGHSE